MSEREYIALCLTACDEFRREMLWCCAVTLVVIVVLAWAYVSGDKP